MLGELDDGAGHETSIVPNLIAKISLPMACPWLLNPNSVSVLVLRPGPRILLTSQVFAAIPNRLSLVSLVLMVGCNFVLPSLV
jgi:hypothetical protein